MFWKKEVPLQDIVKALELLLKLDESTTKIVQDISSDPKIQEKIYMEVFILALFSIDVALHSLLGESKEKAAVMDRILINFLDKVPDGNSVAFIDFCNNRQGEYARALKTPHDLGPPFMVGKKFSQFIHDTPELSTVHLGSAVFTWVGTAVIRLLKDVLKEYKIKY
jgi:hypothetical protein